MKVTGRIVNSVGFTPTNRVRLEIEIIGQENRVLNHYKIGDEVHIKISQDGNN